MQIHHVSVDGSVAISPKMIKGWAVIEDVNDDWIDIGTTSDEVWAVLVQLHQNGSERWIGGIVEIYGNQWGFRFDPDTIIVAEVTIEAWQTMLRGISENLDYWIGNIAVVSARVVEIHEAQPVGGIDIPINRIELVACIILAILVVITICTKNREKRTLEKCFKPHFDFSLCFI